jgi:hypothetical protein
VILRPCSDAGPGDPVCDSADPGTNPSRFLPTGYYNDKIDRIGVVSFGHGYYVMDDLVYGFGPDTATTTPEPTAWILMGGGLLGLCFVRRLKPSKFHVD